VVQSRDLLDDGEPEAATLASGILHTIEPLENPAALFRGNSRSIVLHR
jgi:hypothetical protein